MKAVYARRLLAVILSITLVLLSPFHCFAATVVSVENSDSRAVDTKLKEAVTASPSDAEKTGEVKHEVPTEDCLTFTSDESFTLKTAN